MPTYKVTCIGTSREVYSVVAEDFDHLHQMWQEGDFPRPWLTDCDTDIDDIEIEEEN